MGQNKSIETEEKAFEACVRTAEEAFDRWKMCLSFNQPGMFFFYHGRTYAAMLAARRVAHSNRVESEAKAKAEVEAERDAMEQLEIDEQLDAERRL